MSFIEAARAARLAREPDPPPRPLTVVGSTVPGDTNTWAHAALHAEVERVRATPEGARNDALNTAAFSLGQIIGGCGLEEQVVVDALTDAGRAAGLSPGEVAATIASGITAGARTPRYAPPRPEQAPIESWAPPPGRDPWDDPQGGAQAPAEPGSDAELTAAWEAKVKERFPALDWATLWADDTEEEWIIEPILPARRLVALYSAPKLGKSLLMLEIAVGIARGTPVLGVTPDRTRRVLYVDFENDPKGDIRERLQAMGERPEHLDNLVYLSFPMLSALDTAAGGAELMAAIGVYQCEVVVIDTISRAVAGEENENDTWLQFYRHTGLALKARGISLIRLDHTGKDETKGQRGGSAKSGDVDSIWRMSRVTDDTFQLECEGARLPITEKILILRREGNPLRHRVDPAGRSAAMRAREAAAAPLVDAMDKLDLPHDAGRRVAKKALDDALIPHGTSTLQTAIRLRKERAGRDLQARGHTPWET